MSRASTFVRGLALALLLAGTSTVTAQAAPTRSIHSLTWYVHEDLIDVGAGRDLAWFQALIEDRLAEGEILVEGYQGPMDTPCCVGLDSISVSTFSGAGLDVIETQEEIDAVLDGPAGSYLVQSVWFCNSFSTTIIGCARTGGDTFVVSLDADDNHALPIAMAHERGHNAGLSHVSNDPCELMAGARGGGCIAVSECQAFIANADTTSGSCECLGDDVGDPTVADATACDGGSGLCSGGICGEATGPVGTRLLTAAGSEDRYTAVTDDAMQQSPLAGGWTAIGPVGTGVAPTGLAYDPSRDVVFAVAPQLVGNDRLLTLDPATGAMTGVVATLDHAGLTALAYDPTGDRLFAIYADAEIFGNPWDCSPEPVCVSSLLEIDPDLGTTTVHGELNALIVIGAVQGLAWDDTAGVLYGSTAAGLFSIGRNCGSGACPNTSQIDNRYRLPSALTYDVATDTLYRQGTTSGRSEIDVIDAGTGGIEVLIGIDGLTPGGMAVIPVPEPGARVMLGSGLLLLAVLGHRRAGTRKRPPGRAQRANASEAGWSGLCPDRDHKDGWSGLCPDRDHKEIRARNRAL
jgi:hypothetical protein